MMTATALYACACVGLAGQVSLLDTRALIEQALEEPAAITLDNVRLGDAIAMLTEQTGVKIVMSDEAMALVPHGPDTLVQKVQIANMPLRQGLAELFSPLGMRFVVRDKSVEIVPKETLLCLGRAPTWTELDLSAQLSTKEPGTDNEALAWLQSRIQFLVPVRGPWNVLAEAIRDVGAGSGDEVLTVACGHLGWAWCLSDARIVITPMQEQVRRRLQQPVSLRINNRPLFEALQALADAANVRIHTEPGALASLPLFMQRSFSVNVRGQTAEQVLDEIAAYTGLGYLLEPDGVLLYVATGEGGPNAAGEAAPPTTNMLPSDPYVAVIEVPSEDGSTVRWRWLVRESELPEDLRQMRERDKAEAFEALRRQGADVQP